MVFSYSKKGCAILGPAPHAHSVYLPAGLGSAKPRFSLDACQGILALLDVSFQVCGRMPLLLVESFSLSQAAWFESQP